MNKSIILFTNISLISMLFAIIFTLMIYPNLTVMQMLIFLIIFSLMIALNLNKFLSTSIMSYLTFLMMTGGIMILFTFFLSLISNYLSMKKYLMFFFCLIWMIFWFLFNYSNLMNNYINFNLDYLNFMNQFSYTNLLNLNYLYKYPKNLLIIYLLFYLLFSLMFITKIALNNNKPMRMHKYYE